MGLVKHQLLSPAKINLMLRVLNQRRGGYHTLQTCFQLMDWGDEIGILPLANDVANDIKISGFDGLKTENNLIYKAAALLRPFAQNNSSWQISVNKKIPMGAGLGGGSSNAATVLRFLNEYWQCDLGQEALIELGVKLGADVPVFILNQSALAGGVGEKLTPMTFNTPYVLLLFPDCAINTAALFACHDLKRDQVNLCEKRINDKSFWINDFFPVVLSQYEEVSGIYQQLSPTMQLRLSGTGSTIFALFDDKESAELALEKANTVCKAILTQPLLA